MKMVKWLAIVAVVLLGAWLFVGCGSDTTTTTQPSSGTTSMGSESSTTTAPMAGESMVVGSNMFGTGAYPFDMYQFWLTTAIEKSGDTYKFLDDSYSTDNSLDNIKSLVAGGADGIIGFLFSDGLFESASEFLGGEGIPFATTEEPSTQPLRDEVQSYDNWLGSVVIDHVAAGEAMAEIALANGGTTAMLISQPVGNIAGATRGEAFTKVFEAGGGTVVGKVNANDAADAVTKAENLLLANPDVDTILGTGSDFAVAGVSVLQNHPDVQAKIYSIEVDQNVMDALKNGSIAAADGDNFLYAFHAPILLEHYLKTQEKVVDSDGKAIFFHFDPGVLSPEMVDLFERFFMNGNVPYTDEEIHWMVYEASPDELKAFIEGFSIAGRLQAQYDAGNITDEEMQAAGLM